MNGTYTTLVGRLITDVDRRTLPSGTTITKFRVASTARRFDKATGSWQDGDTLYVGVTCWRYLGDNVHLSLSVGDPIVVHGRLSSRSFDTDGGRRSVTEMEADAVGPNLAWSTAIVTRTKRSEAPGATTAPPGAEAPAGSVRVLDDPWVAGLEQPDDAELLEEDVSGRPERDVTNVDSRRGGTSARAAPVEAAVGS